MKSMDVLKGLTLVYNEEEAAEINKIISFINKYSFLFVEFHKQDNKIQLDVEDFYEFLKKLTDAFADNEKVKTLIEESDFLPSSYITYMNLKKNSTEKDKNSENMSLEMIQFLVSIKYYNYDVNKIYETLIANDDSKYNEIFEKIKESKRMDIYNCFLKDIATFLDEFDSSMLNNLEEIINVLIKKSIDYINIAKTSKNSTGDLKKLTKSEFEQLFKEFLTYINAPKEWFLTYRKLIEQNLITFNYSEIIENGECYLDGNDNIWKIILISDGTIRTLVTFIHEFIHYISKNENNVMSLLEFPSIYYEFVAIEFLKSKGYSDEVLNEIINIRNLNSSSLFGDQIMIFNDVLRYKRSGQIFLEDKIQFYEKWIESMNNFKIKARQTLELSGAKNIPDFLINLETRDAEELVKIDIDNKIEAFTSLSLLILDGYQYFIGSLLASNIVGIENKGFRNINMINVTNHLNEYTITSLLKLFNISLSSEKADLTLSLKKVK